MPDGTVLDGELGALGADGRRTSSCCRTLAAAARKSCSSLSTSLFHRHRHRHLLGLPFEQQREILRSVLAQCGRVQLSEAVETSAAAVLQMVRDHGREGMVAKHADGLYEPGRRREAWLKHRVNLGQEFVIGGYTPGSHGFDALVVGFYRGKDLILDSRMRAGFVHVGECLEEQH